MRCQAGRCFGQEYSCACVNACEARGVASSRDSVTGSVCALRAVSLEAQHSKAATLRVWSLAPDSLFHPYACWEVRHQEGHIAVPSLSPQGERRVWVVGFRKDPMREGLLSGAPAVPVCVQARFPHPSKRGR